MPVRQVGPLGGAHLVIVHALASQLLPELPVRLLACFRDRQVDEEAHREAAPLAGRLGAASVDCRELAGQFADPALDVQVIGVPGGRAEGQPLAGAANDHRQVRADPRVVPRVIDVVMPAVEAGAALAEHAGDHGKPFGESLKSHPGRRVGVPEAEVLPLVPAGPEAEQRAAAADQVEGGDHLREQGRLTVPDPGDQGAEVDRPGPRRQCAQGRVGLKDGVTELAEPGHLDEVIHQEDGIEARPFRLLCLPGQHREDLRRIAAVAVLGDLQAKPHAHRRLPSSVVFPLPSSIKLASQKTITCQERWLRACGIRLAGSGCLAGTPRPGRRPARARPSPSASAACGRRVAWPVCPLPAPGTDPRMDTMRKRLLDFGAKGGPDGP